MYWVFVAYEALCPLFVWLMAEGILPEEFVLFIFDPLIRASGSPGWVADRQHFWIEVVATIRAAWYAIRS